MEEGGEACAREGGGGFRGGRCGGGVGCVGGFGSGVGKRVDVGQERRWEKVGKACVRM